MNDDILQTAMNYVEAGLSVIPIRTDGTKAPCVSWTPYRSRSPDESELRNWFGESPRGIAIIGGSVSGNLLILDFETGDIYRQWYELCGETWLDTIINTLPLVETPGGGCHLYCRVDSPVPGNQKLAATASGEVLIETRGEGGYVLAPGSPGECHPTSREYFLLQGDLSNIPIVTSRDLADYINNCRLLNEHVEPEQIYRPAETTTADGRRPGDDYNQRGDHRELLEKHGWQLVGQSGSNERWRRPGKTRGWSATWHQEQRLLYVFSSNCGTLEPERGYCLFTILAALEHGGDYSAAAKALSAEGSGETESEVYPARGNKAHMATASGDAPAWLKDVRAADVGPVISALRKMHPGAWTNALADAFSKGSEERRPFRIGLMRSSDIPAGEEARRLWFGLYPATVVMIIGETGAGKSSLFYNVALHGAMCRELWGVGFDSLGPLSVLYVDPENSGNWSEHQGGQCARKLDRISKERPTALIFHDGRYVNLADPLCLAELTECIREHNIDICILDPIANLFNTQDENDNAEAARQMRAMTTLSRETRACVVCCHHTGKDAQGNYGRGASARLAAADVGMVFRARGNYEDRDDDYRGQPEQRNDVCRLQIVKNRLEGRASLFLKMIGEDQFERVGFEDWQKAPSAGGEDRQTAAERAAEEILLFLADDQVHSRPEIVDAMKIENISRNAVDEAMTSLEVNELIVSRRLGRPWKVYYTLAATLESTPGIFAQFSSKLPNSDNA